MSIRFDRRLRCTVMNCFTIIIILTAPINIIPILKILQIWILLLKRMEIVQNWTYSFFEGWIFVPRSIKLLTWHQIYAIWLIYYVYQVSVLYAKSNVLTIIWNVKSDWQRQRIMYFFMYGTVTIFISKFGNELLANRSVIECLTTG